VTEVGEPPAIVGVEEDQVRFDAQAAQLANALFEKAEVLGIESCRVELAIRVPGEGVDRGLVAADRVGGGRPGSIEFTEVAEVRQHLEIPGVRLAAANHYLDLSPKVGRATVRQHKAIVERDADTTESAIVNHLTYLRKHLVAHARA
jgi:hypothetical protein